jgi:hypothetical protein
MLDFATVHCPWCGETFETAVDPGEGGSSYIEDCQVCCAPIQMQVVADASGRLRLTAERA